MAQKGILIVPGVLANAEGVIVSYFEWIQNHQGFYWTEEEVSNRLENILNTSFLNVYDASKKNDIDMRLAAYMIG